MTVYISLLRGINVGSHKKIRMADLKVLYESLGLRGAQTLLQTHTGPEKLYPQGRELYIFYTDGIGRSKLDNALIERRLKAAGTARNWNTVTKLLALAETVGG